MAYKPAVWDSSRPKGSEVTGTGWKVPKRLQLANTYSSVSSKAGRGVGMASTAAGATIGESQRVGGKALDQSINIMSGDINPKEIIKIAIVFAILLCITIWVITFARGIVVGMEQFSCNMGNTGCDWAIIGSGNCQQCDPNASDTLISNWAWGWDAEWYARMCFYLCMAVVIGLLLYQYTIWLLNKLLHIDREIAKFDDWIYGFKWEGTAEQAIEQNL